MASPKEYEMLFRLQAELGGGFNKAFDQAQKEMVQLQQEIGALNKVQSDLSAYQRYEERLTGTKDRLAMLQEQYQNLQAEMEQTGESSAKLRNQMLAKQLQIDQATTSIQKQEERLSRLGDALNEAGVDMGDLGGSAQKLEQEIQALKQSQELAAQRAEEFGRESVSAFQAAAQAVAAAGIAVALKEVAQYFATCAQASMDFETAMTGVAKTTDLTQQELEEMSRGITQMSTQIPVTTQELAAIAESAGQLGVQKDAILGFTETMAMLGTATNLSAEEAATALARFANVTQSGTDDYLRMGSVIVALGNSFATTEREITEMATRLASAGTLAGLSQAEILALSAAMSSVGIEAEAGGTAMTETLNAIEQAAASGGESLEAFARIAGMAPEAFAQQWEDHAAGALEAFIRGLSQLEGQGESTILALEELGITGVSQSNMLKSMALAAGQMEGALALANQEWAASTALAAEAEKRYQTTQSQADMLKNAYTNLTAAIGDAYNPALKESLSLGTQVLDAGAGFVRENPGIVNATLTFAGVLGSAVTALAAYAAGAKMAAAASTLLTASIPGVGPILAGTAAVAALAAAVAGLATQAEDQAAPALEELAQAAQGAEETAALARDGLEQAEQQTQATAQVAQQYIDRLEEMGDYTRLSNQEQEQYRNTLSLLAQLVPQVADQIDVQTGAIQGGTQALREQTQAFADNAKAQAYQEYMAQLYQQYNDLMVEAAENSIGLTQAQYQLEAATQKREQIQSRMNELLEESVSKGGVLTQEYRDLQNELRQTDQEMSTLEQSIQNHQLAVEEDSQAISQMEDEIRLGEQAVEDLTAAMDGNRDATDQVAQGNQLLADAVAGAREQVAALSQEYAEAYQAAQQSLEGQFALWDQAEQGAQISAQSIEDAIQSQSQYWQSYSDNMQVLLDRAGSIDGLGELLASFADGSQQSASAVAGLVQATDQELADVVEQWKIMQEEQELAAQSLADLQTQFSQTMGEIQADLEENIAEMDMSRQAMENGRATVQAYTAGAVQMLPSVQSSFRYIAKAAADSMLTLPQPPHLPGYASGTNYAPPGLAWVGEDGPELLRFRGGEQVIPAAESRLMMQQWQNHTIQPAALAATPTAGGTPAALPPVQVTFQVDGAVPNREELEQFGEEFAQKVLEVVETAYHNAQRRRYT